jgi:hypothetical protein
LLDGTGSLVDAVRCFVRETARRRDTADVPTVAEAIDAYLAAKRAVHERGEISKLTVYELVSKIADSWPGARWPQGERN